ncbi:penicillin-binding protein [Nocardioides sp. AN3]
MPSPRTDRLPASRLLPHLGVMLVVAAVLGVVVAGLAIPFAGIAGIGARNVARSMDDLPATLETGDLAQRTRIVDSNGKLITTLYDENRINRPLSQISRNMVQAQVAIEDYRFYQHGALDLKGTLRAFVTNQANSGVVQGGSSITQQLVKITLQQQAKTAAERKAATEDSYARKIKELRYAIALEQAHTKDWILERYLNAAYYGDGAYGVQAAAKHYFNVNANNLSLTQAATLAGLVKNPTGYDPTNSPDRAIARRNVVLDRMAQLHVITPQQATQAKASPLGLDVQPARNGCVNSTAPFFCDFVVSWLLKNGQLPGKSDKERMEYLQSSGLTIKTTLDMRFQQAADKSVAAHVAPTDQAIGALAMVEPGTGNVKGLAQSRPMGSNKKKGETYLNYVVPQDYGDSNGFQAGSTFKLFVLASAIEYNGFPLHQKINSPAQKTIPEANYRGCPGDGNRVGVWPVHNSTTSGMMDAYSGTRESVNTFFAQLEEITGLCNPYKLAQSMGVELTNPTGPHAERVPTFTLGVPSVSPLEMAGAYATVAARGLHCNSRPVTEIDGADGKPVKQYPKSCQQVMAQGTADAVNDILRGVQEPGGFGGDAGLGLNIPSAAKTGTIDSNMTVWYDGYTPTLATASMIAGANSLGHWITLNGQHLKGGYVVTAHGSTTAGPMWGDAMHVIQQWLPNEDFVKPDPSVIAGIQVGVPFVGGMSISQAKDTLHRAGFKVNVGGKVYSGYAVGTVAYSSPSGKAAKGSPITIYPSAGPQPKKKPSGKKHRGGGGGNPQTTFPFGNGNGHGLGNGRGRH